MGYISTTRNERNLSEAWKIIWTLSWALSRSKNTVCNISVPNVNLGSKGCHYARVIPILTQDTLTTTDSKTLNRSAKVVMNTVMNDDTYMRDDRENGMRSHSIVCDYYNPGAQREQYYRSDEHYYRQINITTDQMASKFTFQIQVFNMIMAILIVWINYIIYSESLWNWLVSLQDTPSVWLWILNMITHRQTTLCN